MSPRLGPLPRLLCLTLLAPGPVVASVATLPAPNLAPQHLLHLAPPPESPIPLPPGASLVALDSAYASIFVDQKAGEAAARFDLEAGRVALRVARGVGRGLEVGGSLPWAWLGAGTFDAALSAYHRAVGLPNGGRDEVGSNEFTYRIESNGRRYEPAGGGGLGDAVVWAKAALPEWGALRWAGRAILKLPTGSPDRGLGSGRADAALGFLAGADLGRLRLAGAADAVYVGGTPDEALPLGTRWAAAAAGAVGAPLTESVDAAVQLSYFATPYATGLSEVDRDVLTLAAGLRLQWTRGAALSLGFSEDLAVNASPDFEVFLSLEAVLGPSSP